MTISSLARLVLIGKVNAARRLRIPEIIVSATMLGKGFGISKRVQGLEEGDKGSPIERR